MLSDLQKLWFTIVVRSIILLFCTIMAAYSIVRLCYQLDLESVLWMLLPEAVLLFILTPIHKYSMKVSMRYERTYHRAEDASSNKGGLICLKLAGPYLICSLWSAMFLVYVHLLLTHTKQILNDGGLHIALVGALAGLILYISIIVSGFIADHVWNSYKIIVLNTIPTEPAEQDIEMADLPPPAA